MRTPSELPVWTLSTLETALLHKERELSDIGRGSKTFGNFDSAIDRRERSELDYRRLDV